MARTKPWEVSDDLWERVRPLIPERPPHAKGGRPAADDRQMFAAIVYLVRTGIPWNAMPRERGASSTVYDRFRLWERQGVFQRLWQAGLQDYEELAGLDWQWQSLDGTQIKSPFGGDATGKNPVDRNKRGTKRSQLCEGHGLPLAVVLEAANRNDMIVAEATLDAIVLERPDRRRLSNTCAWMRPMTTHALSRRSRSAAISRMCGPTGGTATTAILPRLSNWPPARDLSRASSRTVGSSNGCMPGLIISDGCWSVGKSALIPI